MNRMTFSRRSALKAIAFGTSSTLISPASQETAVVSLPAQPTGTTQISSAATDFVSTLDDKLQARAIYAYDHAERLNWHWIARERHGVSLKELSPIQRDAGLRLLRSSTSESGYQKALGIAALETTFRHDPEMYFFTLFGEPSPTGKWGWRFEGHHVSMNFTLKGGQLGISPLFFGAWPTQVAQDHPQAGIHTLQALQEEEELAQQLIQSLDLPQQQLARVSAYPFGDITPRKIKSLQACAPLGLPVGAMNDLQRGRVIRLIERYLSATIAGPALMAKVQATGVNRIHFAWAGSPIRGERHSYRLQGPFFMLEHDNSRNGGTHLHSAWREFEGDFGCTK